ncbi:MULTISPECIES: DUF1003 domain-containing protein [unclassified Paenibacillus]|uniref:DUF1003 domain-containing protein n=1 Tax=unclassified Paenibacillus TaxID=185978 RepID=UPI0007099C06|nr:MULTISPECIES: DUF1003 domain-containing protein [unclassified Paenibacillus]KQX54657.1 hypothetical protein ASD40_33930 [Paenibacillus sp. Root444D2]KRE40164.1 hypothetical protein ASG85_34835 [Paenibacillus sp. Soil724D2]
MEDEFNENKSTDECTPEKLFQELDNDPSTKLDNDQLDRITAMVNEYQGNIKSHLIEQQEKKSSRADRLADHIASFGGSWTFIVLFCAFLGVWMIINLMGFAFDKPPFILLNLILSCVSALQAPVILMSQNRQAARDKQEAILDFAINYRAEQENMELKALLERLDKRLDRMEEVGLIQQAEKRV